MIGPSNPYVSVDPILALEGVRAAMEKRPVVALSPILGGRAVKGPLAEMIRALRGEDASPGAIVRHYEGLVRGIFVESGDEPLVNVPGCAVRGGATLMTDRAASLRLAREILDFAATLT